MLKHTIGLATCLLAFVGATAQDEKLKEMKGVIRAIDVKVGTMTLQPHLTDKPHAFSLAAKDLPVVNALGQPLKLADLREELRVTAKIRNDAEVVSVRVDGPSLNGQVKSVDKRARSLIVKDPFGEKTLRIPESAKIVFTGKDGPFEQLKAGDPIHVLFALDKKTVLQVQTGKGINIRDPSLRIISYYGILADVDHAKRTVQVFVQSTDAGIIKSYEVSPDVQLRTMYHLKPVGEIGFEQVAKWVKVQYVVDRDTGRIVSMNADLPVMVRRKVLKFEGEARKLTVEDELKEKTLELAADVKVLTPKGDGKVADIAMNRIVNCGLTLDRSKVQVVYLWDR